MCGLEGKGVGDREGDGEEEVEKGIRRTTPALLTTTKMMIMMRKSQAST